MPASALAAAAQGSLATHPTEEMADMTTIGIIGSGHVGSSLAKAAVAHGYDVVLSNSQGPASLAGLIRELGPHARAATSAEAAAAGDFAIVAIRVTTVGQVPVEPTFPFDDAPAAFAMLTSPHAPGKLAVVNDGPVMGG
jgi:NADP oxidoreductase coenzyme F420-dependent